MSNESKAAEAHYSKGLVLIECDPNKAIEEFKCAIRKGHLISMIEYSKIMLAGKGIEKNQEEAIAFLRTAGALGSSDAFDYLGKLYDEGICIEHNEEKACECFKKAAKLGNTDAMVHYANMLDDGRGISVNNNKAKKLYQKAADLGNCDAMFNLASIYLENGDDVNAAFYFKKAADSGDTDAMESYAQMLEGGKGMEANIVEADRYRKMKTTQLPGKNRIPTIIKIDKIKL